MPICFGMRPVNSNSNLPQENLLGFLSLPTSCKTVYAFMMQMCWKSSASNTL
jgi:hypothetical protein